MKVEIWSDIICPFCYIGKRRFEQALEAFEGKDSVKIVWRSFQLDPSIKHVPGQSVHDYLAKAKGFSPADARRMNDHVTAQAAGVGLAYDLDRAVLANTLDAHRLLHLAKEKGVQGAVKERLLKAYFTEGRHIGDLETLVAIGQAEGLSGDDIRQALQSEAFTADVRQDQYEAQQVGARGVPYFVFNDKYAVSGAQDPGVFSRVLQTLQAEEQPKGTGGQEAASCSADGTCS